MSEICLRIYVAVRGWTANCYVTGLVFFVPHTTAGYSLRPNLRLQSSTYNLSTNSYGLRGPEIENHPPHGTLRIAVLGGSSVFGYLVPDGKDSCRVLDELLAERTPAGVERVEVLNAGVPGYNITQCRLQYEANIAALEPKIVILYLGWNDSKFLINDSMEPIDKTPPAPTLVERGLAHSVVYGLLRYRIFPAKKPKFAAPVDASTKIIEQAAAEFRDDFRALIGAIRDSGATPVVSTQLMASNSKCSALDAYLGSTEEQVQANRRLGQWITETTRDVAGEMQVGLIDVAEQLPCDSSLLGDAIHLTQEGHRQVAIAWADGLAEILAERTTAGLD